MLFMRNIPIEKQILLKATAGKALGSPKAKLEAANVSLQGDFPLETRLEFQV